MTEDKSKKYSAKGLEDYCNLLSNLDALGGLVLMFWAGRRPELNEMIEDIISKTLKAARENYEKALEYGNESTFMPASRHFENFAKAHAKLCYYIAYEGEK